MRPSTGGWAIFFGDVVQALIDHVIKNTELSRLVDGVPLRSHLEHLVRVTGEDDPELHVPPFPEPLRRLWDKFLSLHEGRTYGINGVNPVSYTDIDAWMRVTGNDLDEWEVKAFMKIDKAWLRATREEEEITDGSR